MGQIVSSAAKPKRCNLNQLSQVPTPAAGEYILVSSDNSMNAAGQGNFDCYIVGDGTTAATELELKFIGGEIVTNYDGDIKQKTAIMSNGTKFITVSATYWVSYFVATYKCKVQITATRESTYTYSGRVCIVNSESDIVVDNPAVAIHSIAVGDTYTHTFLLAAGQCLCINQRAEDSMTAKIVGVPVEDAVKGMYGNVLVQDDIDVLVPSLNDVIVNRPVSDFYEYGEVSPTTNSYSLPSGTPTNRARVKQGELIQIPSGATSVNVVIGNGLLANGKYKIGWALYTSGYVQQGSTVKGFYTAATSFTQSVPSTSVYFMFYIASVNNSVAIDFSELDFSDSSIIFNSSPTNYVKELAQVKLKDVCLTYEDIGTTIPSNEDVQAVMDGTSAELSTEEIYEYGEVSTSQNCYEYYPAGSPTNRGRFKQIYIPRVPTGAATCYVTIDNRLFANGKYKVGWAFYTDNYVQVNGSVKGFYTTPQSLTLSVQSTAVYFMFYMASVDNSVAIDFSELDFTGTSVKFDVTGNVDHMGLMLRKTFGSTYPDLLKKEDIGVLVPSMNEASTGADYFIYSVNHRGYSTLCPENTEPAFIMSKKKGFAYIEADVLFTSDAVPVILHDYTINRTARNDDGTTISETINIGSITYQQALTYDFGIWKGEQFAGTRILSFEDFIALMKRLSLHPFIELKDSVNGTYWTDARIESVANLIKAAGMQDNVTFISFALTALQKISVYFPKARLGLGFEGTYSTENFATLITNANSLKNGENKVVVTLSYAQMTDTLYQQLKTGGVEPFLWTVNTSSVVLAMPAQVSGVLSDNLIAGKVLLDDLLGEV